jgi:hypothetical protein
MSNFTIEFESWDEYDAYIKEATAEELHALLLEHAKCWSEKICDMERVFIEELTDLHEAIVIKVVGAKNVGTQTLSLALEELKTAALCGFLYLRRWRLVRIR